MSGNLSDETGAPTQLPTEGEKVAQNSDSEAGMYGCGRCQSRWGGLRTAHCGACHETFTTVRAFDRHRSGSHSAGTRHCLPPGEAGLMRANGRPYPCWSEPTGGNPWAVRR